MWFVFCVSALYSIIDVTNCVNSKTSPLYTSHYRVFTCLHNWSVCLIRHFFLIPFRWRIRQILLYFEIGFTTSILCFILTCQCQEKLLCTSNQIKSLLYSRYYAEVCNEWWGPSPRLSAWATQLRRNVVTVVKIALEVYNSAKCSGLSNAPRL